MDSFDLNNFINDLASSKSTPGGGAVSALVSVLAASLGIMVGKLTVGKKKYRNNEDYVLLAIDKLFELQNVLINDIKLDEECLLELLNAYKLQSDISIAKNVKKEQLDNSLLEACKPPIKIITDVSKVVDQLEILEKYGCKIAYSDIGVAISLCISAVKSASLNVYVNTKVINDNKKRDELNFRTDFIVENITSKCNILFDKIMTNLRLFDK